MNLADDFEVDDNAPTLMSRQRKMRNNYMVIATESGDNIEPMTDEISLSLL
jgi:hypothetical protein